MAELTLAAPYNQVTKRDGSTVLVENFGQRVPDGFSSFTSGTAGPRIKDFEKYKFEGDIIIDDVTRAFPALTIRDFEDRSLSSYTLNGIRFNAGPSGMVMGVTLANGNQTLSQDANAPSTITVVATSNFYSSGHLFTSQRSLIEYTSKTATTFTGYVVSGPNTLNNNDELVQFSGPE